MTTRDQWKNTSPLDARTGPSQLTAYVFAPGSPKRILGYDVETDLAAHYSFAEVILLMLTGRIPTSEEGRAFETTLTRLTPVSTAEAPTHGAALTRLIGANITGVSGVAAVVLAEQCRARLSDLAPFLDWLAAPHESPPEISLTKDADELRALDSLRALLQGDGISISALDHPLRRDAALIAVLYHLGLRTTEQIEAATVIAGLPGALAEALSVTPGKLGDYPVNLPEFEYEE